jgi:bifunctional non-homologous end joining protein LigD
VAVAAALEVGKQKVPVSNLDKVLYPAAKFTKGRVIDYYVRVAPFLLPHFRNRPVTLKRFPNGIHGEAFYEKDAPAFTPNWVQTFPVPRRDPSQPPIQYILINDAATLAWAANSAALELHPFLHRAPAIHMPTVLAFDLDPGEGADLLLCGEVAFLLREMLQKLGLKCFAKVSGSKGLQVYVPLNVPVSYDATQSFARTLAELLARQHSGRVVSDMAKVLRRGKVFVDWSQNADHKTTIGVYSLRAKQEHPYVSMPVKWEELKRALNKSDADSLSWQADGALARLNKMGDLFMPVLKLKQKLPAEFMALVSPAAKGKHQSRSRSIKQSGTSHARPNQPRRSSRDAAHKAVGAGSWCRSMQRVISTMIFVSRWTRC